MFKWLVHSQYNLPLLIIAGKIFMTFGFICGKNIHITFHYEANSYFVVNMSVNFIT